MDETSFQPPPPRRGATARMILGEAVVILAVGIVLALAANQISPAGLKLSRNYFPADAAKPVAPAASITTPSNNVAGTNANAVPASPAQLLVAQMKELGLQVIDQAKTVQLFHDPRYARGVIVFVDARDEDSYREGHIRGAYEFDPYHPEEYLATVLPVCQKAEQIVVYCNGGDCDDSESAAMSLRDDGIDNQKLFIYAGGISEWTNSMPLVTGGRNGNPANPK